MKIIVTHEHRSFFIELYIAVATVAAIALYVLFKLQMPALVVAGSALLVAFFYYESSSNDVLFKIDEYGIFDARLGIGHILWDEIAGVQLELCYRTKFLSLQLKNPDRFMERVPPQLRKKMIENQKLGFTRFNIDIRAVDVNPLALKRLVEINIG